jgi:predicted negative regulator of RcsB-dependent stress response
LAASYDQSNDYENALFAYSKVKGNYEIRALQRAGEIEMQRANYLNANKKYEMMLQNTLNKRYEGNAIAGMLQCNFYLKNYEKVQDLANQLYNKNHTKFWSLADLFLAKIEVEKNNFSTAILQIQKTTQNAQDVYAAEAQYLLAVVLRKQKKYEESTKACIELRSKYSAYMYWVYEAFLLIADNYIDLQNKFQAKATLQSIIDASTDEKIKAKAQQKLTEIGQ